MYQVVVGGALDGAPQEKTIVATKPTRDMVALLCLDWVQRDDLCDGDAIVGVKEIRVAGNNFIILVQLRSEAMGLELAYYKVEVEEIEAFKIEPYLTHKVEAIRKLAKRIREADEKGI